MMEFVFLNFLLLDKEWEGISPKDVEKREKSEVCELHL